MKTINGETVYEGPEEIRVAYGLETVHQVMYWIKHRMFPYYREGATICSTDRLRDQWKADQNHQALSSYREAQRLKLLKREQTRGRGRPRKSKLLVNPADVMAEA